MSNEHRNRRKTIVVLPKQQKRLVMTMSLIPALGLAITMALVCFFCQRLYVQATVLDVHLEGLMPLFLSVSGFVLVSGFFIISNALMISHKIAGPSYRICKSMERVRKGDLAFTVRLRDGDHLNEMADEFGLLLDALNENPPPGFRTRQMAAAEEANPDGSTEPEPELAASEAPVAVEEEPVAVGANQD
jgi:hypothetical protein